MNKNRRPKISKPNLPRSKNNPSGERNDPDVDRPEHAEGRKSEGRNCIEWMGKIPDFVRKLLDIPKGERDRRVSARTGGHLEIRREAVLLGTGKALRQASGRPGAARAQPAVQQVVVPLARMADGRLHTARDNRLDGRRRRGTRHQYSRFYGVSAYPGTGTGATPSTAL